MLLHCSPLAGASTQASLVSSVIVKAVVAENTSGSSGCWQILQTICIQLYWLDLYFCPELCFQCADSPLKCKGVTKLGAEDMRGTYYVNVSNESKWINESKCFLKSLAYSGSENASLITSCNLDSFYSPCMRHDLSKGHGFFVGPEMTYIQSSACGSVTVDIWSEWRLIAPGPAHCTCWSHFSMPWSPK